MLIVAPRGTVNEAIEFFTPIFLVTVSMVIGNVALLLDVENAKIAVLRIFLKKMNGFKPVNAFNSTGYVTNA